MNGRAGRLAFAAAFATWAVLIGLRYYVVPENKVDLHDVDWTSTPYLLDAIRSAAVASLAASAVGAAAAALGFAAHFIIRPRYTDGLESCVFGLGLGFIALSLISQALAYAGWYFAPVIRGVVLTLAPLGVAVLWRQLRTCRLPRIDRISDRCYVAIAALALMMAAAGALAPETEYDALWYHLWLPQQWLDAGRPVDIVEEYISLYPLSWDLAYGAALTLGGAVAAKLLHFICLPLLAITTWHVAREMAPGASAALAVVLTVTAPTVIWEATTAYVDLALTWYLMLTLWALRRYHATDTKDWLLLSAVMLGGALGIKHLALVAAAMLGLGLIVREWHRRRQFDAVLKAAVIFGGIALLIAAPWYLRAYAASGNPVFPDLYSVLGASPVQRWNSDTEDALARFKGQFGFGRQWDSLLLLPWNVTLHGAQFGGALGPLFLILAPFALLARNTAVWTLLAGVCGYAAVWASPISSFQLRFLVPVIPALAILAALGAERVRARLRTLPLAVPLATVATAAVLTLNLPPFIEWHDRDRHRGGRWLTHVVRGLPTAVVVGGESRDAYLRRRVPSYAAWTFINTHLPADARVLTYSGGDHFYSRRARLWSDSTAATPITWGAFAGNELQTHARMRQLGITFVLFDRRQLSHGHLGQLAVGTPQFARCCLVELYRDERYSLHALVAQPERSGPPLAH